MNPGRPVLKEVIAIIRSDKWQATRLVADALGAKEVMHWRVLGRGRQRGLRYLRPLSGGVEGGMQFLPKWLVGWVIESQEVDGLVAVIVEANCTNNYGDGKVFVCPVDESYGSPGVEPDSQVDA